MRKLLWFSKIKGTSSFARVTKSMLKELVPYYDITIISDEPYPGTKFIKVLDDTPALKYADFVETWAVERHSIKHSLEMNMKYIIFQILEELKSSDYNAFVLLNGIYEADFYTNILGNFNLPKFIVWTPFDFRPELNMVSNLLKADIIFTMSKSSLKDIKQFTDKRVYLLEHGHEIGEITREVTYNDILNIIKKVPFNSNHLKESDIVILNANDAVARKQLLLSVKAFLKYSSNNNTGVKLWLHTNMTKLDTDIKILLNQNKDHVIVTHNNISDDELRMIYSWCKIGLQTSSGEGFSMTNIEHAAHGALQIVPNFLATGDHFKNRGILIPVKEVKVSSEIQGRNVTVASIDIDDVVSCISKAVDTIISGDKSLINKSVEYAKSFTWSSIAKKFMEIENAQ